VRTPRNCSHCLEEFLTKLLELQISRSWKQKLTFLTWYMIIASQYVYLRYFHHKEVLYHLAHHLGSSRPSCIYFRIMVLSFNIGSHCCSCCCGRINLPAVSALEKLSLCLSATMPNIFLCLLATMSNILLLLLHSFLRSIKVLRRH
jgi:hypothetical protein